MLRLRIADVDRAVGIDEDPMGSREGAEAGIAAGRAIGVRASNFAPSGVGSRWPLPIRVVMTPDFIATLRMRWFLTSQIKRSPARSKPMLCGSLSCAAVAGPPSPLNPGVPLPAIV